MTLVLKQNWDRGAGSAVHGTFVEQYGNVLLAEDFTMLLKCKDALWKLVWLQEHSSMQYLEQFRSQILIHILLQSWGPVIVHNWQAWLWSDTEDCFFPSYLAPFDHSTVDFGNWPTDASACRPCGIWRRHHNSFILPDPNIQVLFPPWHCNVSSSLPKEFPGERLSFLRVKAEEIDTVWQFFYPKCFTYFGYLHHFRGV